MHPDRRQEWAWLAYDWANSAYITTVAVALLPVYFTAAVVGPEGVRIMGTVFPATSLWGYVSSLSALIVFLIGPTLGAVADARASRKRFLGVACMTGAAATTLLFTIGPGRVWTTLGLFLAAQIAFVAGNIFYDSLLPLVAPPEKRDMVSGRGFAVGYVGGGLQFALSLGLLLGADALGLTQDQAARIAMASAGLWWGGFSLITLFQLREPAGGAAAENGKGREEAGQAGLARGAAKVLATLRDIGAHKPLLIFMIAFFFYNDGVQTTIIMASIYGKEELGFSNNVLMLTLLLIQAVGVGGALLFSRLAGRFSARKSLMATLVIWIMITMYACFLTRPWEYFILGGAVGLVLGGTQSLSRSLFTTLIPRGRSAEFFGYFSSLSRISSIGGPLVFGLLRQMTGSSRWSAAALSFFFIVGFVGLAMLGRRLRLEASMAGTRTE